MRLKRIIIIFLVVAVLFNGTSCSNEVKVGSGQLVVYRMDFDNLFSKAARTFNEKYKDCNIKEKIYSNDEWNKYIDELASTVDAGFGPDIVVIPESMNRGYLGQLIAKGAFYDINQLISEDDEFKISDFNEKVMEGGLFKGKRYLMPVSFTVPALLTTSECLQKNNISIDEKKWTWNQLGEIAKEFSRNNNKGSLLGGLTFSDVIENSEEPFVDYIGRKALFDCKMFRDTITAYKESNIEKYINPDKDVVLSDNGGVGIRFGYMRGLKMMNNFYNKFQEQINPMVLPVPSVKGNGVVIAKPSYMVAINSKCKNLHAAYEYIKIVLSKEIQNDSYMYNIPVNKAAYEQQKNALAGGTSAINGQSLVTQIDKMVKSISGCEMFNNQVFESIQNPLSNFIGGYQPMDITLKSIYDNVMYYLFNAIMPKYSKEMDFIQQQALNSNGLKIYYINRYECVKTAIRKFKSMYKNITINETEYQDVDFGTYISKLTTELMAGEGPDIILAEGYTFKSIHKVAKSGVLEDLDGLMAKDSGFNLNDCFGNIMEYGKVEGKRYFIPFSYNFYGYYTTKDIIESSNTGLNNSNWNLDNLVSAARKYMKENRGREKFFLSNQISLGDLILSSGVEFVDYKNKTTKFNTSEFIGLLKAYKELNSYVCPSNVRDRYNDVFSPDPGLIKNKVCVLYETLMGNHLFMLSTNKYVRKSSKSNILLYPYPNYNGQNKGYIQDVYMAGINSNSRNKADALNFIKVLISEEVQEEGVIKSGRGGATVNKLTYEKVKNFYMYEFAKKGKDPFFPTIGLEKKLAGSMDEIISSIQGGELVDYSIQDIVRQEADEFINGNKTAEEAAKAIDEKATLFINE